jgi:hypothetical protein
MGALPMHRFFGLLALSAAALGFYVLLAGPDAEPRGMTGAHTLDQAPVSYGLWALGLVMGLTLAWLAGIDWPSLRVRTGLWFRLQRKRIGWAVLGGLFASILLLF